MPLNEESLKTLILDALNLQNSANWSRNDFAQALAHAIVDHIVNNLTVTVTIPPGSVVNVPGSPSATGLKNTSDITLDVDIS